MPGKKKMDVTVPFAGNGQQLADSEFVFVTAVCNRLNIMPILVKYETVKGYWEHQRKPGIAGPVRPPFLVVHGNVMYDLYYQSNADTPYLQKESYQHTLTTVLTVKVKDQYPMHVAFTTRMGNSPLYRNLTDFNLQFTNRDFKDMLMQRAQGWDGLRLKQWKYLDSLKGVINTKEQEIGRLQHWDQDPSQLLKLIQIRERQLYGRLNDSIGRLKDSLAGRLHGPDSLRQDNGADSLIARYKAQYDENKQKLDSLQAALAKLQRLYDVKNRQFGGDKKQMLLGALNGRGSNKEMADKLENMNLPDSVLPKGYRQLLAVRSFGIGRTMVNYSELTAKNISVLGMQVEYNPSYYFAFATGVVDYRFRDFVSTQNRTHQYLNLIRIGTGNKDRNNIILTYYTGRKQLYNFNTTVTDSTPIAPQDYRIMGLSLEGHWALGKNTSITGELAKSSLPYYARAEHGESVMGSVLQLHDHSNEAYSIKAISLIPQTGTRINASYKMMGANFQSFSLYTTGSKQSAWNVRVDQPFFKQRLMLTGAIKKNEQVNAYQLLSYNSSTVFKSLQATLRMRKWPVLSVGYFPSEQITKLGDGRLAENQFYTLVGTASHFYKYHHIMMSTILSYTQFYNKQADTSFLYFNSKNILLNHTVFLDAFTINGSLTDAINTDYKLYGIDGSVQWKLRSWLTIGGGLKYNWQTTYNVAHVGYTGMCRVVIPKVGEVALMADKGFVPGVNRQLVANNTGRLTYTKTF